MSTVNWRDHVNSEGDFELALFSYRAILGLMKQALDLGTLLSDDDTRLQAYRHQVKGTFKVQWLQLAEALESYGVITPCICTTEEYCKLCAGSRYHLNSAVDERQMREITNIVTDEEQRDKLRQGLERALAELGLE